MTLVPNQPYPDLIAWEDLESILISGWGVPGDYQSLQGKADKNDVTIFGRVQIGDLHIFANVPLHLSPARPISLNAQILGGPSCLVELQYRSSVGIYQMVLSAFSLGMTNAEVIATYKGKYLSIFGTYPRKAV
ncbi:hypothetical protein [Arthrobacter sp. S41]|uniref:hypothetical protein n=1 Tax=Arthrobacter sp. S41 TaxID=2509721 RepID=UPI001035600B|nr:hypothetical protein [Arthrobacter sp. S41]TAP26868.1 hypothetical protein EYR88_00415 [Arthrobacter sp. S41]